MHEIKTAPDVYVYPVRQPDKPRDLSLPHPILIGGAVLIGLVILALVFLSGPEEGRVIEEPVANPAPQQPAEPASPVAAEQPPAPVEEKVAAFPPQPVAEDIPAQPAPVLPVAESKPAADEAKPVETPKPAPEPAGDWLAHKVAKGENLATIFSKLGLSTKLLLRVTKHPEGKTLASISPGQTLKVKGKKKDGFDQMIWEKSPGESLIITETKKGFDYQSTPKKPPEPPKPQNKPQAATPPDAQVKTKPNVPPNPAPVTKPAATQQPAPAP